MDYVRLSKVVSHALRHAPWRFELELDSEGWTPVIQLLEALRQNPRWKELTYQDLERMTIESDKQRFDLQQDRIRALYGHSLPGKIMKARGLPPDLLYHGTTQRALPSIRARGLLPQRRQYVHMSLDPQTALSVGTRKGKDVVVLQVRAREAEMQGVAFYVGNEQVWLADFVPAEWILFP